MPTKNQKPATLKAAARATTGRKRRGRNNRHRPGYIQPNKIGTKLIGADAPIAVHAAFRRAAAAENKTMKGLILEFVTAKAQHFMTPDIKQEPVEPTLSVRPQPMANNLLDALTKK